MVRRVRSLLLQRSLFQCSFLKSGCPPSMLALHLRDYALSMGSLDNISVIALFFPSFLKGFQAK